jgi:hypothetical protein
MEERTKDFWEYSRMDPKATMERDIHIMMRAACLPKQGRIIPILITLWIGVGACSLGWNPSYYVLQKEFWSAHIMLLFPIYMYLCRKRSHFYEILGRNIDPQNRIITLVFYWLFMAYWAYFCYLELYNNREDPWFEQIGNVVMSVTWYIFFAVASALYYFTTTKLLQRAEIIKDHVGTLTKYTTKEDFFHVYDYQYDAIRTFGNTWNRMILLVMFVLTINLPADALSVFVKRAWFVIPGLVMKSLGLLWYVWCICKLNYMVQYIPKYLHKHHVLQDSYEEIARYMEVRPLFLNFFGLKITFELVMKILMIGLNLLLPTLYALFSNQIISLSSTG